jgi:hypothetical protein
MEPFPGNVPDSSAMRAALPTTALLIAAHVHIGPWIFLVPLAMAVAVLLAINAIVELEASQARRRPGSDSPRQRR